MNLGALIRAELFRARRTKLALLVALMYVGVAAVYLLAGSGAWVSTGGEGQFLGFSADPEYLQSAGAGSMDAPVWLSIVSSAHTVFFPIIVVVVAATLFDESRRESVRGIALARGLCDWQIFVAKAIVCELYVLCSYIAFTFAAAAAFTVACNGGLNGLAFEKVAMVLLSNVVIGSGYTLMVAAAFEVFRIRPVVSGVVLVATFAGLVIAMSFPATLPPVHMAFWIRACGSVAGSILVDACLYTVIVSSACALLLACHFNRKK